MYDIDMKRKAKEKLKGNWGNIILVGLMYYIPIRITMSAIYNLCLYTDLTSMNHIAMLLLTSPIIYGANKYFMGFVRGRRMYIKDIFYSYNDFSRIVIATLLKNLFILPGALLFIIPGIMKAYSYSMTYNIMNDNPEISGSEALKLSKKMMTGYRMNLFKIYMTTIGWAVALLFILALTIYVVIYVLLGKITILATFIILTVVAVIIAVVLFVTILWLVPLYMVSKAYFYEKLKEHTYTEIRQINSL